MSVHRRRGHKKRVQRRMRFMLSDDFEMAVAAYAMVQPGVLPKPERVTTESNQLVVSSTAYTDPGTGESIIKSAQRWVWADPEGGPDPLVGSSTACADPGASELWPRGMGGG